MNLKKNFNQIPELKKTTDFIMAQYLLYFISNERR